MLTFVTDHRQIALFEKFKTAVASSEKHVFAPTQLLSLTTQLGPNIHFPDLAFQAQISEIAHRLRRSERDNPHPDHKAQSWRRDVIPD